MYTVTDQLINNGVFFIFSIIWTGSGQWRILVAVSNLVVPIGNTV